MDSNNTVPVLFTVKFWTLLGLSVPSAICSLLIFIYFYKDRKNLSIHLHFTLLLVVISFLQITTDNPFAMAYYHRGEIIPASNIFCLWWNWWDYSTSGSIIISMAWGSVERHILVFYDSLMRTKRKRMIYHVSPMVIVCTYPLIFYCAVIILNPCENDWDYTMLLCIQPCYLVDQPTLATYDFLANIVFPVSIIAVANICLVVRVVRQKRARRQSGWSRQRKLTLQLLYVAIIFVVFWIPLTINGLIGTFTSSDITLELQTDYFFFFAYLVPILIPFVALSYLPHFRETVFSRGHRRIAPFNDMTNIVANRRDRKISALHHAA